MKARYLHKQSRSNPAVPKRVSFAACSPMKSITREPPPKDVIFRSPSVAALEASQMLRSIVLSRDNESTKRVELRLPQIERAPYDSTTPATPSLKPCNQNLFGMCVRANTNEEQELGWAESPVNKRASFIVDYSPKRNFPGRRESFLQRVQMGEFQLSTQESTPSSGKCYYSVPYLRSPTKLALNTPKREDSKLKESKMLTQFKKCSSMLQFQKLSEIMHRIKPGRTKMARLLPIHSTSDVLSLCEKKELRRTLHPYVRHAEHMEGVLKRRGI